MGKRFWAGMTKMWVLVLTPALPLTGYVTLGRLFHFQCSVSSCTKGHLLCCHTAVSDSCSPTCLLS